MSPATNLSRFPERSSAFRAISTPFSFTFATSSDFPASEAWSLRRLAPKVAVVTTSAPASRYAACTSPIFPLFERTHASGISRWVSPAAISMLPMPPSKRTTLRLIVARKSLVIWLP